MNVLVFSTTQLLHELNTKRKDDRVVKTWPDLYADIRDALRSSSINASPAIQRKNPQDLAKFRTQQSKRCLAVGFSE